MKNHDPCGVRVIKIAGNSQSLHPGRERLPHEKFVCRVPEKRIKKKMENKKKEKRKKKRKGDPRMARHGPDYGPFVAWKRGTRIEKEFHVWRKRETF